MLHFRVPKCHWLVTACLAGCLAGCSAGVRHRAIAVRPEPMGPGATDAIRSEIAADNAAAEAEASGIRYYGRSLYLIANSDGRGGLEYRLTYLPDPTKLMSAEPYAEGAKLTSELNFSNGMLGDSKVTGDGTVVAKAVVEAVKTILPAVLAILEEPAGSPTTRPTETLPAPTVYKVITRGDEVQFLGSAGNADIIVTLPKEAAK